MWNRRQWPGSAGTRETTRARVKLTTSCGGNQPAPATKLQLQATRQPPSHASRREGARPGNHCPWGSATTDWWLMTNDEWLLTNVLAASGRRGRRASATGITAASPQQFFLFPCAVCTSGWGLRATPTGGCPWLSISTQNGVIPYCSLGAFITNICKGEFQGDFRGDRCEGTGKANR